MSAHNNEVQRPVDGADHILSRERLRENCEKKLENRDSLVLLHGSFGLLGPKEWQKESEMSSQGLLTPVLQKVQNGVENMSKSPISQLS